MGKFLVTGGAGFIGSNLALELERGGHKVAVLDDFSSGHFKNLIGFKGEVIGCDLNDVEWFDAAQEGYDAIFHEAAITDTTVRDQKKMMEVNVEGFRKVLWFAMENGVKRVVYASSAGVYGNSACPMRESSETTPENVYGFSKAVMDNVAANFAAQAKGMTIVGLRYFNVYGPGEAYKGKVASMIYQLYRQMKAGTRPRIFKFGEQQRDFVYVKDVVSANLLALKAKESCVVNVGTGKPEDFNKVIACLNSAMGTKFEPEYFDNPYDFFQNKTQARPDLAAKKIGYKAKYTLDKGIAEYVKALERK